MKILTPRNNKDYYDYLTGIVGTDELIVFDRRKFTVLSTLDNSMFSFKRLAKDCPKRSVKEYVQNRKRNHWINKMSGEISYCLLEVGHMWYLFSVERYLDEDEKVNIDWSLVVKHEIAKGKHIGATPMTFFTIEGNHIRNWEYHLSWMETHRLEYSESISNPILRDTPITSFITPFEIYDNLYAFIASNKDVEIIDTRTDVQKAESAGFDHKTSFRKIK